jgi:hypothetical protein
MQHNPFELHAHMAHVKCVFVVPSFGGGATLACNDWRMRREGGGQQYEAELLLSHADV